MRAFVRAVSTLPWERAWFCFIMSLRTSPPCFRSVDYMVYNYVWCKNAGMWCHLCDVYMVRRQQFVCMQILRQTSYIFFGGSPLEQHFWNTVSGCRCKIWIVSTTCFGLGIFPKPFWRPLATISRWANEQLQKQQNGQRFECTNFATRAFSDYEHGNEKLNTHLFARRSWIEMIDFKNENLQTLKHQSTL